MARHKSSVDLINKIKPCHSRSLLIQYGTVHMLKQWKGICVVYSTVWTHHRCLRRNITLAHPNARAAYRAHHSFIGEGRYPTLWRQQPQHLRMNMLLYSQHRFILRQKHTRHTRATSTTAGTVRGHLGRTHQGAAQYQKSRYSIVRTGGRT